MHDNLRDYGFIKLERDSAHIQLLVVLWNIEWNTISVKYAHLNFAEHVYKLICWSE